MRVDCFLLQDDACMIVVWFFFDDMFCTAGSREIQHDQTCHVHQFERVWTSETSARCVCNSVWCLSTCAVRDVCLILSLQLLGVCVASVSVSSVHSSWSLMHGECWPGCAQEACVIGAEHSWRCIDLANLPHDRRSTHLQVETQHETTLPKEALSTGSGPCQVHHPLLEWSPESPTTDNASHARSTHTIPSTTHTP